MLLRRITDFLLQGRTQAIGAALVCALPSIVMGKESIGIASLIGLLSTVSVVITAFITLRKGVFEGFLVLLAATLPVLIGDIESMPRFSITDFDLMLMMIVSNILTWLFAVILERYACWSIVLEATTLVCILVVSAIYVACPDVNNWWEMRLTSYVANSMQIVGQLNLGDVQAETAQINSFVALIKPYITGAIVSFVAFNALMQVLAARWWQAAVFSPGSLRNELYHVRLSCVAGVVFVAALVLSYWGNDIIVDLMPILYFTFGLAGLSLLHFIFALTEFGWLWLSLSYLVTMIMGMTLVAMLGLLDTWLDFRKRARQFF
jgi:hypothetical protein